jgi:RHS repeat-associated protein
MAAQDDYYPYGGTRISVGTNANEKRQFIGQFTDDSTLSYLNARYYDPNRGQFLSEDPLFINGPTTEYLIDPQSLNSYSYANDNPVSASKLSTLLRTDVILEFFSRKGCHDHRWCMAICGGERWQSNNFFCAKKELDSSTEKHRWV